MYHLRFFCCSQAEHEESEHTHTHTTKHQQHHLRRKTSTTIRNSSPQFSSLSTHSMPRKPKPPGTYSSSSLQHLPPASNQVCCSSRAGDSFFLCFSSDRDPSAQVLTGRLVESSETLARLANFLFGAPLPLEAVIFREGGSEGAGRAAVPADGINGAGARVLTVSDWVQAYGECNESRLWAWMYGGDDEEEGGDWVHANAECNDSWLWEWVDSGDDKDGGAKGDIYYVL